MDYGRKDFFIATDMGFREDVAPSWYEGWKANVAYNHMPLTRFIDEQNKFGALDHDPSFTMDRFLSRMKSLPESHMPYYDTFARAKNEEHFDFLQMSVAEELQYKDEGASAPLSAVFAAGITDLVNLGFLIPGVGQVRAAKTGLDAVKTAAKFGLGAGLVSEARRAPFAYADSDYESAMNIGMTTMFSAALGGSAHYLKPFIQSTAKKTVNFAQGKGFRHIYDEDGAINLARDADGQIVSGEANYDRVVNNFMGSPTQKIGQDASMPVEVKEIAYLISNNSAVGVKGNLSGAVAKQSLQQKIAPGLGSFYKITRTLRNLHAQQISGYEDAQASTFFGAYNPLQQKSFNGFLEDTFRRKAMADSGVPELVRQAQDGMTKQQADAIVELERLFKAIDEDARYYKVLGNDDEINARLIAAEKQVAQKQKLIDDINSKAKTQAKMGLSKAQSKKVADLTKEIDALGNKMESYRNILKTPTRSDFSLPIYYNKELLMSDDVAREGLTQKFEAHYIRERADADPDDVFPDMSPRESAERTVARILQEDADDFESLKIDAAGGAKHLRNRKTNIPVHEVLDYMILDEDMLYSYLDRMNKRIAFGEVFGGRSIDEVLTDAETAMRKKGGFSEEKIARTKADLYGDYERVMGTLIRRPDRLDNQAVRLLKSWTGWTYLPFAGISAMTDTGSIVMAHGAKNVVSAGWAAVTGQGYTSKIFKNLNMAGEAADITRNIMAREMISDTVRRIQPNMVEKFTAFGNKAFYTMNGLAPITVGGKTLDSILVQDKFVKLAERMTKGKLNAVDREFMARYGIDQELAEYITKMPVERHPSQNFFFSNTDAWPIDTVQQREALRRYQSAIAGHSNNTIIMATSFDKPQFMDGLMYMRDNAFFQQVRKKYPNLFKIEERVSTAGQKMVRMDTQILTLPFTFMNFAFGANNKIVNVIRDPIRQNKLQGVVSLLALSYLSLDFKDRPWWRGAGNIETVARVVDHSGLLGIYSDLGYMGMSMAVNSGAVDPSDMPIPPKYIDPDPNRRMTDALTEPFGAPVGLATDAVRIFRDYMNGNYGKAHDDMYYIMPFVGLPYLRNDAKDLWNAGRG